MVEWIVEEPQIKKVDPVPSQLNIEDLMYSREKIGEMIVASRNNKKVGKLKKIYDSLTEAINRSL